MSTTVFSESKASIVRRHWYADVLVLAALIGTFWWLMAVGRGMSLPFDASHGAGNVSTNPYMLPYYAMRSLFRMFAALGASLIFAFIYATLAARVQRLGHILMPLLDILQSVPILGFLSVTVNLWISLFPGSMMGIECASIFAIFTSQAWNLAFAFHHSLRSQPRELDEVGRLLRLTKWQRFWRLDVPSGMIPLTWNGMMSFGGGWFFLTASEVISVGRHTYALPGIGSYVAAAAQQQQVGHIALAIGVMIVLVVAVDTCFWAPLVAWAGRFTLDSVAVQTRPSWVLRIFRQSRLCEMLLVVAGHVNEFLDRATRWWGIADKPFTLPGVRTRKRDLIFNIVVLTVIGIALAEAITEIHATVGLTEFIYAGKLGVITMLRVLMLVVLSTLIWVPVGVWIGMSSRVSRIAQPVVQVLASFPANFLFPVFALLLMKTGISLDLGGVLLMALGSQWYILFNVIAGASAIPFDLREAMRNLQLSRWLYWQKLVMPAVFSSWVTGALSAAGGAWNASIVAEIVTYGKTTLVAHGLGAYISEATIAGDSVRILVGVTVMSVFVVFINRILWMRLYRLAEQRYSL